MTLLEVVKALMAAGCISQGGIDAATVHAVLITPAEALRREADKIEKCDDLWAKLHKIVDESPK